MNITSNFRKFFIRGLGILLPTVLTIWILIAAYQFVQYRIAEPINQGVRELVVHLTDYPAVVEEEVLDHEAKLRQGTQADKALLKTWRDRGESQYKEALRFDARRVKLLSRWNGYKPALDLIGLAIAAILIYIVGLLVGSLLGRAAYARGESLLKRAPIVRHIFPHVKQVTDFFVGGAGKQMQFNRVVAVEYPRKGVWSGGLVTGNTMRTIQDRAQADCMTIFVPSSPTPFTGYVITVPKEDTIDLPISIDDALRFTISGGVIVPEEQLIPGGEPGLESKDSDA